MAEAPDTPAVTGEPGSDSSDVAAGDAPPERRSLVRSVSIGIAIAVALAATTSFLIAIPFWTLASFESNGIDRPIVRTGLFRIALPVGAIVGVVGGAVVGRWLHHGGRWTVADDDDRYSTR